VIVPGGNLNSFVKARLGPHDTARVAGIESSTEVNAHFVEAVGTLESHMNTMRKDSVKPHVTSRDTEQGPGTTPMGAEGTGRYSVDFNDPRGQI
jgi:hypothetical protein